MRTKLLLPLMLCAAIALLLAFGVASCGDDDGDGGGGETTVTTAEDEGGGTGEDTTAESEPGDDSGGSTPAPSGDAARSEEVEIEDFEYRPDPVTIEEGGKVIWKNRDSAPHTATAEDGSFDTGTLEEDKIGSESFKEPGTYAYICSIHPEMKGTVEVVEG
jgi:plastocyanin